MIKKRFGAMLLIAAFALSALCGCAGSGASSSGQNTTAEVVTPAQTEGAEPVTDDETERETYENTENINKDMESMKASDIVSQMNLGISIGNSLDSTNSGIIRVDQPWKWETAWGNPKITEELVDALVDAGFTTIRIPVSWTDHLAPGPDYLIVESWMDRVQEVVDYAYDRGVYVILNLHHEDWNYPYYDNQEKACEIMEAVWRQIAERFKDYDEHLIFEGQNEPRKVGTSLEWSGGDKEGWDVVNATNKAFIETIRSSGGSNPYRMLMIPDYAANSAIAMEHLEVPEDDDRIIVSIHAYTPYNFALNANGSAEWNNDSDSQDIDTLMSSIKRLFTDKGIPVIIGEFGAVNKDNAGARAEWLKYYMSAAKEIGVPCFWWDNGSFNSNGENLGFIDRRTYEIKYPELLEAMKEVYPG
ncbi:MAG: glycoside hydrolase family 5 protein [Butyrivibrio sp.]|nr:glycoside hydrolase family 5 protein [Butyrivibrio sp.]